MRWLLTHMVLLLLYVQEREATQAQLSGLRASLDASTAHVQSLQQEVQEGRDETQALKADGDELRQQLAQQHEQHALTMQTLADVQRQLGTARRELEQAKEMVSACFGLCVVPSRLCCCSYTASFAWGMF
jgi:chromosome segregation ATPase